MTANIDPLLPPTPSGGAGRPAAPTRGTSDFSAALARAEKAAASDAVVGVTPPPELAAHIAAAARAWEALSASGRHVSFDDDLDGGLSIRLHDDGDGPSGRLTASQLFDLIDQEGSS